MKHSNLIIALILFVSTISSAGELGRSGGGRTATRSQRSSGGRPSITAPSRDASAQSGTLSAHNTGIDSIRIAARAVREAVPCTDGQFQSATLGPICRNIQKTNQHKTLNMTNLRGCTLIRTGVASGYGCTKDRFFRGRDSASGVVFNPTSMTAACAPSLKGQIVIVRNKTTNVARAVTCVDTGAFNSKYGRIIDLAQDVFKQFGLRCDSDGLIPNVELYRCPNS